MRKRGILCLLLLLPMLLCACSGGGERHVYGGTHTHVWGAWQDVTAVTCVAEGEHICYCKICGESYTEVVPVATEIAARAHDYEDTVTPPTEALDGFTRRLCRTCGFVVERTNEIPARYALILPAEPLVKLEGLTAQLAFDTAREQAGVGSDGIAYFYQNILACDGAQSPVTAEPAWYLAAALVAAEAVEAEALSLTTAVPITAAFDSYDPGKLIVGTEVTVENLIKATLGGKNRAAVAALASVLAGSDNAFLEKLNTRMATLGVELRFSGMGAAAGSGTLKDTAVLLWRVVECELLSARMDMGFSFAGKPCVARFDMGTLRLSAVRVEDGFRIVALAGESIPATAESELYRGSEPTAAGGG